MLSLRKAQFTHRMKGEEAWWLGIQVFPARNCLSAGGAYVPRGDRREGIQSAFTYAEARTSPKL